MDLDKLMQVKFTWDNKGELLKFLTKEDSVRFAVFCAKQVIEIYESKFADDNRPRKAIEAAETWLIDPNERNAAANAAYADAAYADAYAAARAAYAAYAAAAAARADAAYAVYAAAAAYAAARAASAASAASAAYATNKDLLLLKQDQMDYLRDLIISSLTEEEKENWLLIASI